MNNLQHYKMRILELEEQIKRLKALRMPACGWDHFCAIQNDFITKWCDAEFPQTRAEELEAQRNAALDAQGWEHYCAPQNDLITTYDPECSWCGALAPLGVVLATMDPIEESLASTTVAPITVAPLAREGEQLGELWSADIKDSGGGSWKPEPWNGMSEAVFKGLITEKEKASLTLVDRMDAEINSKEDRSNYAFLTDDFGYYEEDEDDYDINQDRDEDDG